MITQIDSPVNAEHSPSDIKRHIEVLNELLDLALCHDRDEVQRQLDQYLLATSQMEDAT